MKILKFKEAFIDQNGQLNDGTSNDKIEKFKKLCIEGFNMKPVRPLESDTFYNLSLEFQEIYMKLCIEKKVLFDNDDLIIENTLEYFPIESKKYLSDQILFDLESGIKELSINTSVIDNFNDEFQKIIINTIINNSKVFYLHENQYNSFNSINKKLINRYRDIIKIY